MGAVRTCHRIWEIAIQPSHSVDTAGWQAKMASIQLWIQWCNAHGPHWKVSPVQLCLESCCARTWWHVTSVTIWVISGHCTHVQINFHTKFSSTWFPALSIVSSSFHFLSSIWEYEIKFHTKGFLAKSTKFFAYENFFFYSTFNIVTIICGYYILRFFCDLEKNRKFKYPQKFLPTHRALWYNQNLNCVMFSALEHAQPFSFERFYLFFCSFPCCHELEKVTFDDIDDRGSFTSKTYTLFLPNNGCTLHHVACMVHVNSRRLHEHVTYYCIYIAAASV